jgi:alpha-glucosidase
MGEKRLWWKHGVIYQIYPRSFYDSNGDGVGDIPGIIEKLDYLADLGIDAIWLSPVNSSPMHDFGYDVSDYREIDPVFGTKKDFKRLISEAHGRNIRIIMDMVLNHTSYLHPWFIESRGSRDSAKRDWFIWRDGKNGRPPTNWMSAFYGSAWEWDERTGQYYLHSFLREQPDVNWRNPGLKAAMFDVLRYWLDRGVDGFRLDVVNWFSRMTSSGTTRAP